MLLLRATEFFLMLQYWEPTTKGAFAVKKTKTIRIFDLLISNVIYDAQAPLDGLIISHVSKSLNYIPLKKKLDVDINTLEAPMNRHVNITHPAFIKFSRY